MNAIRVGLGILSFASKIDIIVEGNHWLKDSYTSQKSTSHARVTMTTEEFYIIVMTGRCVNNTQAYHQKVTALENAYQSMKRVNSYIFVNFSHQFMSVLRLL